MYDSDKIKSWSMYHQILLLKLRIKMFRCYQKFFCGLYHFCVDFTKFTDEG